MSDKPVAQSGRLSAFRRERQDVRDVAPEVDRQRAVHSWSKEFLEAGKKRLAGDTARQASSGEIKDLRREMRDLQEALAEQMLENRLLKKSMTGDGGDGA